MANRVHLRIVGMNCAGCVEHVSKALRGVAGVDGVNVDLMSESATVDLDALPEKEVSSALIEAVRGAGYDAEVSARGRGLVDAGNLEREHREKLRQHRQGLAQALGLIVPILAVEHLRHLLWPGGAGSQIAARFLEIVLFLMLCGTSAAGGILAGGLRALWHRAGSMDALIALGVSTAFLSSIYGTFARREEFVHIHAAAMIIGLVCVGRYLETRARIASQGALVRLMQRAPAMARVQRDGEFGEVPVERVVVGDVIQASAGSAIACDGEIVDGQADVDESLMTGEAMPVSRARGERVLGGTVVRQGVILFKATAVGADAAVGRIVQLVRAAQAGKPPMQRMADRVAGWFTAAVLVIATLTLVGWLMVMGRPSLGYAMSAAIAVLVVACPCALGLATPTVVTVATGLAALRGILVRDAGALEAGGDVDVVVWDKTGTLTVGRPMVVDVEVVGALDAAAMMRLAGSAEQASLHPLGKAIENHARQMGLGLTMPSAFELIVGGGVAANVEGKAVLVGSLALLDSRGIEITRAKLDDYLAKHWEMTAVGVAVDGQMVGFVGCADAVRPSAAGAVFGLRRLGIGSEILTGDAKGPAEVIAKTCGITSYLANCSPADKATHVAGLRREGKRVAMVGDGVNDAAALAAADVGIAFATGAHAAGEAAGIHLMGATPGGVVDAVVLSRASRRIMQQNLFWAFAYNVLMIPLAAFGKLPPAWAAGAMMISSLTVVLNALRLRRVMGWREAEAKAQA